jgi:hypothetical protein
VKLGININNVDQIHNTRSDWNEGGNLQRESRAIRDTSHTTIIKNLQRQQEESEGFYEDVRFEVKLFRHAAVATYQTENGSASYSSDLDRYARAIEKEIPIQHVMRMLMVTAVDCNLNKNRNTLPESYDYSIDCNYQKCEYKCYQTGDSIDDSTYDVYYLKYKLRHIILTVYPLLKQNGSIRYKQIFDVLQDIPKQQIIAAINELIANKISVKDKYGNYAYVCEAKDIIYLSNEYSNLSDDLRIGGAYYSLSMINLISKSNDHIFNDFISEEYAAVLETLKQKDYPDVIEIILSQSIDVQVKILEQSILNRYSGKEDFVDESVIYYYQTKGVVFDSYEPVTMIREAEDLERQKDPRGRKATIQRKEFNLVKGKINYFQDTNTEVVTFHILYIEDYTEGKKKHGEMERYLKGQGRYRLYKPSEGYWRDLNKYEYEAYSRIVGNERQMKIEALKNEFAISGIINDDTPRGFKIMDVRKEMKQGIKVDDAREKSKGFVCTQHVPFESLFFYAWYLGVDLNTIFHKTITKPPPKDEVITENFVKNQLKLTDDGGYERSLQDLSQEESDYYYHLYLMKHPTTKGGGGMSKAQLCDAIKQKLQELNAIDDRRDKTGSSSSSSFRTSGTGSYYY